jgi:acyl carrier protein
MSKEKIRGFVRSEIAGLLGCDAAGVGDDLQLVGSGARIKSRALVELMLACEEFLEAEFSTEFNWYSDAAMSGARSRLRTVGSLIDLLADKAGVAGD